jgi:hypothetical protein
MLREYDDLGLTVEGRIQNFSGMSPAWIWNIPRKPWVRESAGAWREPGEPYSAALTAAAHSVRGEADKAAAAVARLLDATPSFSLRNIRHSELYRDPERLERYCGWLRKAGLPE